MHGSDILRMYAPDIWYLVRIDFAHECIHIGKSKRPQFILEQTVADKMNGTLWPDAN